MRIQVQYKAKTYYIAGKEKRKPSRITQNPENAEVFDSVGHCKNVRDDVLEEFGNAAIVA